MCARWLLIISAVAMGQLPPGAVVIEHAPVRADRELVLWMVKPERFDRGPNTNDNPYTCPERTRGHHYIGPTRVSLVEPATKRVLNTVPIHPYEEDSFDVPYRIVPDYYYRVPGAKPGEEGTPKLLDLRDFNGDGLPLEAAFYEAQACMGLLTTLVGYSPKQDRVVQYPVDLRVIGDGPARTSTKTWADYLFSYKPVSPGRWLYEIDYRGRAGSLDAYDIRYDSARERFHGTLRTTASPP
jgi:hypothetical protein